MEDGITSRSSRSRGSASSPSAKDLYPSSVSRSLGQLTLQSGEQVIKTLKLMPTTRLLYVGSAYGRFCIQAAHACGAAVTGIEAITSTAQQAEQFLNELCVEYPDVMTGVRSRIKLVEGNILCHLDELFNHSRFFIYDKCFVEETWIMLAHLFSYLSGVNDIRIIA